MVGGYHGSVTGDLLGYKLPSTLAATDTPCHLYGSYNSCAANPRCGWCGSSGGKESFVILSSPASLVFILFIVNTLSSSPSHLVILCRQVPPDLRGVPLQQQPAGVLLSRHLPGPLHLLQLHGPRRQQVSVVRPHRQVYVERWDLVFISHCVVLIVG